MTLKQRYKDARPIVVYPITNFGGLVILDIDYIDNCVVTAWDFGDGYMSIRRHKVYYSASGRDYIVKAKRRYYIDDFVRV